MKRKREREKHIEHKEHKADKQREKRSSGPETQTQGCIDTVP
jgi:hypothetical protein